MSRTSAIQRRIARAVGVSLIVGLWLLATYLVLYYSLLFSLGPERLHAALGDHSYNLFVPVGGFPLLFYAAVWLAWWILPLSIAYPLVSLVLATAFGSSRTLLRRRLAALFAVVITASLQVCSLDGWPWWLIPLLSGDDTEFARTYSPLGFWRVSYGITKEEVRSLVGEPLEQWTTSPHEESWAWSRSPHSEDYRQRVVRFRDDRVVERHSEYYID